MWEAHLNTNNLYQYILRRRCWSVFYIHVYLQTTHTFYMHNVIRIYTTMSWNDRSQLAYRGLFDTNIFYTIYYYLLSLSVSNEWRDVRGINMFLSRHQPCIYEFDSAMCVYSNLTLYHGFCRICIYIYVYIRLFTPSHQIPSDTYSVYIRIGTLSHI